MLLAIESSCDETAVAVLDPLRYGNGEGEVDDYLLADLVSSQTKLHEPYGGVVPELAAREHIINLPLLVKEAFTKAEISTEDIKAVAVTRGPGLKGCLLVGLCYAKALSLGRGIPLLPLNHIEGHIFAGMLLPAAARPEYPLLALVVSGGHTMLVHADAPRSYRIAARTRDDAAGEAFDKGAMLLGLPYPGGPSLSKAAVCGDPDRFRLPVGVAKDASSFSFSGLKTALQRLVAHLGAEAREEKTIQDLCASYQKAVVRALCEKSAATADLLRPQSFVLTGGVAANLALREALAAEMNRRGIKFCVPDRKFCTDNAAMIGALGCSIIAARKPEYGSWNPQQQPGSLGPRVPLEVGALARWPLDQLVP